MDISLEEQEILDSLPDHCASPNDPATWPAPHCSIQEVAQNRVRRMLNSLKRAKERLKHAKTSAEKREVLEVAEKLMQLWDNSVIEQWLAIAGPKQMEFIRLYREGHYETLAAIGSNRSGKSASAGLAFAQYIRDEAPQDAILWVVGPENSVSINGAQKLLWTLLPHALIDGTWTKKNGFGSKNPMFTYDKDGRNITVRFLDETQFENNDRKIEGTSVDRLWIDESIGHEMFGALVMRLLDSDNTISAILLSTIPNAEWMYANVEHADDQSIYFERFLAADNPVLTKEKFLKALRHTPEHKRNVRLLGKFDLEDSRVIPEYDPKRHDISIHEAAELVRTMDPKWYAGLDIGMDHPTVFLLGCTLKDGRFLVYREYAARKTTVETDIPHIKAIIGDRKLESGFVAIDPSAANDTKGNPLSVMEMYICGGVECFPAVRTQIAGEVRQVQEIREMFANDMVLISDDCKVLKRNLRLWKVKRDRHNKPMSQHGSPFEDKENDGIDAWKYMLTQLWFDSGSFQKKTA